MQDSFDRETHAGKKVKELDKLGQAQFTAADGEANTGHFDSAVLIFEKYRDNVRAAFELLKKQEPDVDKHSAVTASSNSGFARAFAKWRISC